jgi:O-antigen/teichoic acid export membrane protein
MPQSNEISMEMPPSWRHRVSHVLSHLRFQPFDHSTEEGRAKERHRRILLTALAAGASKAMGALTAFISIPLTIRYLDKERNGLWMTLSTCLTVLSVADLGIGNGLLNRISEANAKDDRPLAQRGVSSAFFMLCGVAAALLLVFFILYRWINWPSLLKLTSPQAMAEAGPATLVIALCFALNLPLGIVNRVQLGYQQGFVNSIWTGAGNVLALLGVLTAVFCRAGLPWLVAALAGAPVVTLLCNGLFLFFVRRPWLRPHWKYASYDTIKELMRVGGIFFILSICFLLTFLPDNFIVLTSFDQGAVTDYTAVARVFSIAPIIMEMLFTPLWPAYGEAAARGDVMWITKTLTRSLKGGLLLTAGLAIVLVGFGRPIIALVTNNETHPNFSLLLGFGCWSLIAVWSAAVAVFLNGVGVLKVKTICAVVLAAITLPAKFFFCAHFGLAGIIWAMVITYLISTFIPLTLYIPTILARLRQSPGSPGKK